MITWAKTALVFPGQASQGVGMGAEIAAQYPSARAVFQQADEILNLAFSKILFEGPEEVLNDTVNTQPAMYVCGIALLRALESELGMVTPAAAAGHSVGELTALTAAGALDYADGVRLVRERARLMQEAGKRAPGAMAALLNTEAEIVRDLCTRASADVGGVVVVANDNCPGQIVISGDAHTLDRALELAKEAGIKRAIKLAVSVAAHSPLMTPAAFALKPLLEATTFTMPRYPVYSNITAQPIATAESIRTELEHQITGSVLWTGTIQGMIAQGVDTFIELGPKDVLTGLIKRIDKEKRSIAVGDLASLTQVVAEVDG